MLPLIYNFNYSGNIPVWTLFLFALSQILWIWSVVGVATRKTKDPFDRIVWLLVVLFLNIIGTILYFFFAADELRPVREGASTSEADIKRRANEGTLL